MTENTGNQDETIEGTPQSEARRGITPHVGGLHVEGHHLLEESLEADLLHHRRLHVGVHLHQDTRENCIQIRPRARGHRKRNVTLSLV